MNRERSPAWRWVCALPLLTALACTSTPSEPAAPPVRVRPPNIVLLLADDLGCGELGCYGQQKIRTPAIDALASAGMRFRAGYSGAPVCAPSRNSLLTGLHLGHTTIRGNLEAADGAPRLRALQEAGDPFAANLRLGPILEGQMPLPTGVITMASALRRAGYATGGFGKWGLGPVGSSGDPLAQGFDRFYGYLCQAQAHSYYPGHLWDDGQRIEINQQPVPGHQRVPTGPVRAEDFTAGAYAPDLILDQALRFIRENRDQPFFAYLPFIEPHVALQPPIRLVNTYPPEWDQEPYRGEAGYTPHPRPRAAYAALISSLDEHVGRVLALLDELGLASNTLVVFTSDNGTTHRSADGRFGIGGVDAPFFHSTAGLRGYKGSVYEGGLRVPYIARWTGRIAAGSVADQPVYFADQLPTLLDACGVPPPPGLDGTSLWPVLSGRTSTIERPPMIWVFTEYGGQVAIRIDRWKVVRQGLARPGSPGPWELYDVVADPSEAHDVAAQHADVLAQAVAILRAQCADNPLFPLRIPE